MNLRVFYPSTGNAARRQSKAKVLLALYTRLLNFELAAALRHNAWFWSLCYSSLNFSGNFQLQQLRKFVRIFQAPALIPSPNRFISALLHSAERVFLRGLWLQTLESSWLFGINQRIFGHYAAYSWSGNLGFLRLTRLFPLIPIFSFNPYFLLLVVLEAQIWPWSSSALAVPTATCLSFPKAPPRFSRGSSWEFPARSWCWLAFCSGGEGKVFQFCHHNRITLLNPERFQLQSSIWRSDLDSHGFGLFWEAGERGCDSPR